MTNQPTKKELYETQSIEFLEGFRDRLECKQTKELVNNILEDKKKKKWNW